MASYYPLHLRLAGKLCVVIGGGAVAERRAAGLREAGARVRIVSPRLTPALQAQADAAQIEYVPARYAPLHLADAFLVFAATDSRQVNAQVAADAAARNLLVNVADAPEEGDFLVPSVVRRGSLQISLSTGGSSPTLTARLCAELETRFGPEYGDFLELLARMRAYIKRKARDSAQIRLAHAHLLDAEAELRALLRAGQREAAQARAEAIVTAALES
jgi:precorrin-2 dehydrogenase/sirohydrochlorin ferrochelatase